MKGKIARIRISGERGTNFNKSVIVEVTSESEYGYTVRHTDGKRAFISKEGGAYARWSGPKYITLWKKCTVEFVDFVD